MTEGRLIAGRYRTTRRIGAGAMGIVWAAHDERLDRVVALKELRPATDGDSAHDAETVRRATREARVAARVRHPNAVTVHDVVEEHGRPVLVMEYVAARTLAEHGTLPPDLVRRVGAQIAAALAAAHEVGVVHRDVKPGNVLLADDGTAKITDFGIARAADDVKVTRTGLLAGTPAFLSPEAARGDRPGPASDVFSLGATLYAAVEGTPPFGDDDNAIALLHTVASGRFRPPTRAGALTDVLLEMLRTEPEARPTMAQAAQRLRSPDGSADTAGPPVPQRHATRHLDQPPTRVGAAPPRGRRPLAIAIAAVTVVGLAALAAVLLAPEDPAASPAGSSTAGPTTTTTAEDPTTTTEPPVPPQELERVVAEYYDLLPKHSDKAWDLLGPDLRTGGRSEYRRFWKDVDRLKVTGPPEADGTAVTVTVEYTTGDQRVTETHRHGVVRADEGLLIVSDEVLASERTEDDN